MPNTKLHQHFLAKFSLNNRRFTHQVPVEVIPGGPDKGDSGEKAWKAKVKQAKELLVSGKLSAKTAKKLDAAIKTFETEDPSTAAKRLEKTGYNAAIDLHFDLMRAADEIEEKELNGAGKSIFAKLDAKMNTSEQYKIAEEHLPIAKAYFEEMLQKANEFVNKAKFDASILTTLIEEYKSLQSQDPEQNAQKKAATIEKLKVAKAQVEENDKVYMEQYYKPAVKAYNDYYDTMYALWQIEESATGKGLIEEKDRKYLSNPQYNLENQDIPSINNKKLTDEANNLIG